MLVVDRNLIEGIDFMRSQFARVTSAATVALRRARTSRARGLSIALRAIRIAVVE